MRYPSMYCSIMQTSKVKIVLVVRLLTGPDPDDDMALLLDRETHENQDRTALNVLPIGPCSFKTKCLAGDGLLYRCCGGQGED